MTELARRRRAIMGMQAAGLPSDYQRVEWIGCDGTQFIQTDVVIGQPTLIYCESDFMCQNMSGTNDYPIVWNQGPYGSGDDYATYKFPNVCSNKTELQGFGINRINKPFTVQNDEMVSMTFDYRIGTQIVICNGLSWTGTSPGPTRANTNPIRVLKSTKTNPAYDKFFNGRLYHFRIDINGTKSLDLIPCYKKANGEIGVYDLVGRNFLTNAGTGTFTKGADVN